MLKFVIAMCLIFCSTTFGFLDIYLGNGDTKTNHIKKPSLVNIGISTKLILEAENSIIQSQSKMFTEGIIIAINTSDISKFGLSFYGGKNIDDTLFNTNIDFALNIPLLSGVDLITGFNVGATRIEGADTGCFTYYSTLEPQVGFSFNLSQSFSVLFCTSIIYGSLVQSTNKNANIETVNSAYSILFKMGAF